MKVMKITLNKDAKCGDLSIPAGEYLVSLQTDTSTIGLAGRGQDYKLPALKRRMPHPQAAILGCTHYPLMQKTFAEALGPDVKVYSQANLVAESLADYLTRRPEMLGSGTQSKFLTTGDPVSVSSKATQFLRKQVVFEAA
mgnify:CR=1 FL=1